MTYYSSSTCFSLRRIQLASFEQPSNRKGSHLKQVGFVDFSGIGCPRRNWQYSLRFYGKKNMETSRKRPCCGTISFGTRAATRKTVHNVAFPLLGWVCASYLHPDKGGSESNCKKVSLAFVSAAIRRWIAKAIRWLLIAWVSLLSFSNTCSASSIETQGLSHVLSTNFVLAEATFHPSVPSNWRTRPEDPISTTKQGGVLEKRRSSSFVTEAVKAVGPSVVRIDTERKISTANDPLLEDPFFKKFFGDEFQKQLPRERTERGQGSGFIISKDGLILTNAHVVKNAEKVTVTLTDGRAYLGTVKGTDDLLDLAVIRIDPKGRELPVAPLGNSSELQVGDWVIALGNPVGLDNTVTLGIVSSLNRSAAEVGIPEKKIDFIQTDAAINPGNSGGPLVNEFGQVVGINAAIRANAEGIGFAIPIDKAKAISDALAKGKKIQHPFIGIQMSTITPELAKQNNDDPNAPIMIPEVEGALIVRILPKTPAAEAGLRRFDVIQAVDGHAVKSAKEVQSYVDNVKVGQVIHMKVLRGGDKSLTIAVRTGDLNSLKETKAEPRIEED
jgi:S1-C subfamily serine protease